MVEARHRGRLGWEDAVLPDLGEDGMILWAAVRRLSPRQRAVLVELDVRSGRAATVRTAPGRVARWTSTPTAATC